MTYLNFQTNTNTRLRIAKAAVLGLAILLGLGFVIAALYPEGAQWLNFLGRFHIVVLHVPIGVFYAYLLFLLLHLTTKNNSFSISADILLALAAVSSTVAAVLGFFLATEGGFNDELLFRHKLTGSLFTLALLAGLFLRLDKSLSGKAEFTLRHYLLMVVATLLLFLAGHKGGSLTHGSEYLTRHLQQPESEQSSGSAMLLTDSQKVMKIFEAKCIQCHGPEKQKSKYRMDDPKSLFAGGSTGETAIVPGDAAASHLVYVIQLPKDDDEVMPPEGKEPLTDAEIDLIVKWIAEGGKM